MLRKLNAAGDTIVEVMVVLAVLGLAISIAYATANRSLLNARQAQKTPRASVLAQSQLEQVYAHTSEKAPATTIFRAPPFCFDDGGNFVPIPASPFPLAC